MRRAAAPVAALLLLLPALALAARIEGRVVHPTRSGASAQLPVFALGLTRGGEHEEKTTTTDADGRFVFDDLPSSSAWLVGARYAGLSFPGGSAVFEEGKPELRSLVFHVYDRAEEPVEVGVRALRWIVEREATRYRMRQAAVLHNPTLTVVVADDGDPALARIPLPRPRGRIEGARLPEGTVLADGHLDFRGPLLPGEREVQVTFDLVSEEDAVEVSLPVHGEAEEVVLLVRDFGVEVDAGALHPARPVREGDQIYLRFVGFDMAGDSEVPVRIRPLPPRGGAPRWFSTLLTAGLAFGLALVVARPIDRRAAHAADEVRPVASDDPEAEALDVALRDLEFDFETGKLSEEDRDRLRDELRRDAARALAQRRARHAAAAGESVSGRCECGRVPQAGDRYCASCGKAL